MGQQQLLLLVLGVIIVGIAIVVGINLFSSNAVDANRNAVITDLNTLAEKAWTYRKKATNFGGGGGSFVGFTIPTGLSSNANGTYLISIAGSAFTISFDGTGTETGDDGTTPVKYTGRVTPEKIFITKTN